MILGGNTFYELPSSVMQERCVILAREALAPGKSLFVDNDDYAGNWSRLPFGKETVVFEGTGGDGTSGRETRIDLRFDEAEGVLHMKRIRFRRAPDGTESRQEYLTRKHPVSFSEVRGWLEKHGFEILKIFGDRQGRAYPAEDGRAIFWARRRD